MPKPKIPNQKYKYSELDKRLAKYVALVQSVYGALNLEAAKQVERLGIAEADLEEKPFRFADYPETRKKIADIQKQFVSDIRAVIYRGTSEEWKNSNEVQDLLANAVLKTYDATVDGEKYKVLYQTNSDALKAFRNRKDKGMNLSAKLWNQSAVYRQELEAAISCAVEKGYSAVTLSKRISKYLNDFPSLQRDYGERYGKAKGIHDCHYQSMRLARSEINMAYRTAENERWKQMDFVVGYEIKLSGNHNCKGVPAGRFSDICDTLAGKYPKDFKWTGWHPNCYSDDSEVLTDKGWKLFKDVCRGDLILSLNPTNRNVEWVGISALQCYAYNGSMVHFYNRSLDCLVTPDHQMVYLSKSNGKIMRCPASSYRKGNGAFYRGCEYVAQDVDTITIGGTKIDFDLFCEFMGYWLSDGSTIRKSQIVISQQDGEKAKPFIVSCIERMGLKPHVSYSKIDFYNNDICLYLKRFGTCIEKYVPKEIKEASKRQIRIFLDAFIKCDGYIKKPRPFVGNRGGYCKGTEERMYFTTSNQLASDLGEMILKIGKRPSYRILSVAGKEIQFKNGLYKTNYDEITISECTSVTATVFDKEIISYNGKVYDLTLERNHIMYIRRRGKCFWGSNCRCYKIPILKTEEEFWEWDGRSEASTDSVNSVKDVPDQFKKWVLENSVRIEKANAKGTLPYFLKDNKGIFQNISTEKSVSELMQRASDVGNEVQSLAYGIASRYSGYVTPVNYKSKSSITRKVNTEHVTPYDIKDAVRTTIIAPKSEIESILKELNNLPSFIRLKRQKPESFMGYSGNIVNIRTSNGLTAEIQVNTDRMIYAKELPEEAKRILGENRWNEIHKETGLEGGIGHKYYEEWRMMDKSNPKAIEIAKKSAEYYSHFQ